MKWSVTNNRNNFYREISIFHLFFFFSRCRRFSFKKKFSSVYFFRWMRSSIGLFLTMEATRYFWEGRFFYLFIYFLIFCFIVEQNETEIFCANSVENVEIRVVNIRKSHVIVRWVRVTIKKWRQQLLLVYSCVSSMMSGRGGGTWQSAFILDTLVIYLKSLNVVVFFCVY